MRHRARWSPAVATLAMLLATTAPMSAFAQSPDDQWWHEQWRMDEVRQITDGSGVTVAVIDSGVEASLPEVADAVLPGIDLGDPDGDGRTDHDDEFGGHGTSVASLIVGNGTGSGIHGVAPGAAILPIAQGPRTSVHEAIEEYAVAIRWAVDHDADVINMSLNTASGNCPDTLVAAVRYALENDVVVVAGAGNLAEGSTGVPAMCPGVLTVGASDPWLEPWEHTHRSEHVDVAAPGYAIPVLGRDGAVTISPGTSLATALTSGAVALVRAHFPDASAEEVLARVIATSRDIHDEGRDDATGYGLVRPFHALDDDVPADAPNPVIEALAALAPTATPSASSPLPPSADSGEGSSPPVPLVVAAGAVLALLAGLAALVTLRRRRSRPAR